MSWIREGTRERRRGRLISRLTTCLSRGRGVHQEQWSAVRVCIATCSMSLPPRLRLSPSTEPPPRPPWSSSSPSFAVSIAYVRHRHPRPPWPPLSLTVFFCHPRHCPRCSLSMATGPPPSSSSPRLSPASALAMALAHRDRTVAHVDLGREPRPQRPPLPPL